MTEPPVQLLRTSRWVVCDKPSGWLSVPSRMGRSDPRPVLGLKLQEALGNRIWPVHRLDVEVSGLVLYALDAEAHRAAGAWFESHAVVKTYEAWTSGDAVDSRGSADGSEAGGGGADWQEWRCRLVRGKKRAFEADHGKDSITMARRLGHVELRGRMLLRWQLQPKTGRSHQLRYELARHGHPIAGDKLYGSDIEFGTDAIALRAIVLDFAACPGREQLGIPPSIEAPSLAAVTSERR